MLVGLITFIITITSAGLVLANNPPQTKTGADGLVYSQILTLLESGNALGYPSNIPSGQPLQLDYPTSTTNNKYWRLIPTNEIYNDNTFILKNLETGLCADAKNGRDNYSAVMLSPCSTGTDSQIWTKQTPGSSVGLYQCVPGDPANSWAINTLAVGKFWNYLGTKNGKVLDFPINNNVPSPPGTQLQIFYSHNDDAQYFRFVPTGDGKTYTVLNKLTNFCLEVLNGATTNYSPVGLNTCTGNDIQKWSIQKFQGDNHVQVVSASSGKCLNVYAAKFEDHNPVIIYDCVDGDEADLWHIELNMIPDKQLELRSNNGFSTLTNVEVTVLLWGSNVQYKDQYPDFYSTLLKSSTFNMLEQYNIGPGTYKGMIQLPLPHGPPLPQITNSYDNAGITSYIQKLVEGGFLKPNGNTYYAIHFPPEKIDDKDVGGCAYHSAASVKTSANDKSSYVSYGVMPDVSSLGPCNKGNIFDTTTSVAAHELFEAITDPYPGTGYVETITSLEIGDLCSWQLFKSPAGANGKSYVLQKFWSNAANACVE
ncbi:hypothetical protein HDU76_004125 [Blyttiomyces sp. JEL0837]|nr:hypothetical protein HDU76_004125 [Blyttiomyces sp. JEL0837]